MTDLTARRQLYRQRALMAYPEQSQDDSLRIEGITALLERVDGPIRLRLPQFDLALELDQTVDAKSAYLIAADDYEMADLVLMQTHMQSDDQIMIVGGGIGVTAALAAKLTAPKPVVVVEANPRLHAIIERQIRLNGGSPVIIGGAMVGDVAAYPTGRIGFEISEELWYSRISAQGDAVQVPVVDMAQLCVPSSISAVMIDIEGAEREVFSRPVPACVRLLIVEIHTPDFGGVETARLVSLLTDQRFRLIDQLALVWVFARKPHGEA
jgi:FkbM family methyltransferase